MTAQIILADFKGKTWITRDKPKLTVVEGPTDFAALEAEIAVALWLDPEHLLNPYQPEEKEPA